MSFNMREPQNVLQSYLLVTKIAAMETVLHLHPAASSKQEVPKCSHQLSISWKEGSAKPRNAWQCLETTLKEQDIHNFTHCCFVLQCICRRKLLLQIHVQIMQLLAGKVLVLAFERPWYSSLWDAFRYPSQKHHTAKLSGCCCAFCQRVHCLLANETAPLRVVTLLPNQARQSV